MNELNTLIRTSLNAYKENIGTLTKVLWPYILVYSFICVSIEYLDQTSIFITLLIALVEMIISGLFIFAAINIIVGVQPLHGVSSKALLIYFVATLYVFIAILLGMLLLIIPAFFVLASTFLYPLLILKHNQGPVEAISNSVALTKGQVLHILVVLFLFSAIVYLSGWPIDIILGLNIFTDIIISTLYSAASTLASLYLSVVMLNVYSKSQIKHNKNRQQDAIDATPLL